MNDGIYRMRSTVDKSIPIENVHCLAHFLLWWYLSISHTIIAQCIFSALEHHNHRYNGRYACTYDKSITTYRKYRSLPRQYCTRACGTRAIRALTSRDISLYMVNNIYPLCSSSYCQ